jgi:hypothetical protein
MTLIASLPTLAAIVFPHVLNSGSKPTRDNLASSWGMAPRPGEENCKQNHGEVFATRLSSSGVGTDVCKSCTKVYRTRHLCTTPSASRIVSPSFAAQRRVIDLAIVRAYNSVQRSTICPKPHNGNQVRNSCRSRRHRVPPTSSPACCPQLTSTYAKVQTALHVVQDSRAARRGTPCPPELPLPIEKHGCPESRP